MERVRRNERLAVMARMLSREPNTSIPLARFCDLFDAAKSTVSEDLDILRQVLETYGLGTLETIAGAAGGVRFRTHVTADSALGRVRRLCERFQEPGRVLPGSLLYCADLLCDPRQIEPMGEILATVYAPQAPDFVLTVEAQGIPLAMMTARAMGIPAIIARRTSKVYEGSTVHINYLVDGQFKTMTLSKRLVRAGQKALLIDDILRSGGTVSGMIELMKEFQVEVVGAAVLIGTREACERFEGVVRPLMVLEGTDERTGVARVTPGGWIGGLK